MPIGASEAEPFWTVRGTFAVPLVPAHSSETSCAAACRAYQRCEDCKDEQTCRVRAVFGDYYAAYILMIESLTLRSAGGCASHRALRSPGADRGRMIF